MHLAAVTASAAAVLVAGPAATLVAAAAAAPLALAQVASLRPGGKVVGGRLSHQLREHSGGDAAGGDASSKGGRWGGVAQGGAVRACVVLQLVARECAGRAHRRRCGSVWVLFRVCAPSREGAPARQRGSADSREAWEGGAPLQAHYASPLARQTHLHIFA